MKEPDVAKHLRNFVDRYGNPKAGDAVVHFSFNVHDATELQNWITFLRITEPTPTPPAITGEIAHKDPTNYAIVSATGRVVDCVYAYGPNEAMAASRAAGKAEVRLATPAEVDAWCHHYSKRM